MVNKTSCKLYKATSSYTIALKKSFVEDSGCSFEAGDKLDIQMVGSDKMIITKVIEEETISE